MRINTEFSLGSKVYLMYQNTLWEGTVVAVKKKIEYLDDAEEWIETVKDTTYDVRIDDKTIKHDLVAGKHMFRFPEEVTDSLLDTWYHYEETKGRRI